MSLSGSAPGVMQRASLVDANLPRNSKKKNGARRLSRHKRVDSSSESENDSEQDARVEVALQTVLESEHNNLGTIIESQFNVPAPTKGNKTKTLEEVPSSSDDDLWKQGVKRNSFNFLDARTSQVRNSEVIIPNFTPSPRNSTLRASQSALDGRRSGNGAPSYSAPSFGNSQHKRSSLHTKELTPCKSNSTRYPTEADSFVSGTASTASTLMRRPSPTDTENRRAVSPGSLDVRRRGSPLENEIERRGSPTESQSSRRRAYQDEDEVDLQRGLSTKDQSTLERRTSMMAECLPDRVVDRRRSTTRRESQHTGRQRGDAPKMPVIPSVVFPSEVEFESNIESLGPAGSKKKQNVLVSGSSEDHSLCTRKPNVLTLQETADSSASEHYGHKNRKVRGQSQSKREADVRPGKKYYNEPPMGRTSSIQQGGRERRSQRYYDERDEPRRKNSKRASVTRVSVNNVPVITNRNSSRDPRNSGVVRNSLLVAPAYEREASSAHRNSYYERDGRRSNVDRRSVAVATRNENGVETIVNVPIVGTKESAVAMLEAIREAMLSESTDNFRNSGRHSSFRASGSARPSWSPRPSGGPPKFSAVFDEDEEEHARAARLSRREEEKKAERRARREEEKAERRAKRKEQEREERRARREEEKRAKALAKEEERKAREKAASVEEARKTAAKRLQKSDQNGSQEPASNNRLGPASNLTPPPLSSGVGSASLMRLASPEARMPSNSSGAASSISKVTSVANSSVSKASSVAPVRGSANVAVSTTSSQKKASAVAVAQKAAKPEVEKRRGCC